MTSDLVLDGQVGCGRCNQGRQFQTPGTRGVWRAVQRAGVLRDTAPEPLPHIWEDLPSPHRPWRTERHPGRYRMAGTQDLCTCTTQTLSDTASTRSTRGRGQERGVQGRIPRRSRQAEPEPEPRHPPAARVTPHGAGRSANAGGDRSLRIRPTRPWPPPRVSGGPAAQAENAPPWGVSAGAQEHGTLASCELSPRLLVKYTFFF